MLPGTAAAVPDSSNSADIDYIKYNIPSAGAFPIVTSVGMLIPLEGAIS